MRFFKNLKFHIMLIVMLMGNGVVVADSGDAIAMLHGDYYYIDSLKQLLNTQPLTDKQKIEIYLDISGKYHANQLDSSIYYANQGIPLALKMHEYYLLGQLYIPLGVGSCFLGEYETALSTFDLLAGLAVKPECGQYEAQALSMKGFAYVLQGKYNTSIDYYLKALKIYDRMEWTTNSVSVLANLSEINRRLGNTEIALNYLREAEVKCELLKKDNEPEYNWRMPQVYNEYASNYLNRGDYDEALRYALKADSVNAVHGTINHCHTNSLLATIYLKKNDYDRALQYAKESYKYADILKDVTLYAIAGKILSDVYLAQKRYKESESEALKVWLADSTNIDESRAIAKNIALANIYMGNTDKAAYFLNKFSDLNMQFSEKSFHTTVSDLAIMYEIDKKEVRIASLEKERQLYVWLGIAGVLLALALVITLLLYIRNVRKERRLIASEATQEGEIGERVRIAEDLHDRLGGSLTAVKIGLQNAESLHNINDKLDECMKELREITNNIIPRSLRLYGMKGALEDFSAQFASLQFHFFGEDNRIKHNLEYTMYCCAKELVHNALKHSGATNIHLQLVQSRKHVSLTVQDDGNGFDEKTAGKGDGLQNIRHRVASCRGKMDMVTSPGRGTETVIELKIETTPSRAQNRTCSSYAEARRSSFTK